MRNIRQSPYALRVVQRKTGKAAIIYQRKADHNGRDRLQRVASISPLAFTAATPLLLEAVSKYESNEKPVLECNEGENQPHHVSRFTFHVGPYYPLDADYGARVAFFAIISAGLRDGERLMRAANHLRHADPNEAAWWLGLLTRDDNSRALRALRILTEAVK